MPIINIKEQKNSLRAKHKKIRTACPKEIRAALDKALFEKFVDLKEYKECSILFAFVSMPIEINTYPILEKAIADEKYLFCQNADKASLLWTFIK